MSNTLNRGSSISWGDMTMTAKDTTSRMWVVLTFGEDRQHAGNAGYDDVPDKWYSYDSYVANHRQISSGHCLLICNRERALGIARIKKIDEEPSTRVLQRCSKCQGTGIKKRLTKQPLYRCKNGHEFEEPVRENVSCTKYTARFTGTFEPFTEVFGRDFLRQGCPRYGDQNAMQEFEYLRMAAAFRDRFPKAANVIANFLENRYPMPEAADEDQDSEASGYAPTPGDERQQLFRQIRARRGQQAFREELRARYGDRCAVSGCGILEVLEAAHIRPYRGNLDNHVENGLLLRADLHTLFDLDLIGIEPFTLTVHLHPDVSRGEYQQLHGSALSCSNGSRPSQEALLIRWEAFKKRQQMA
jgi:putative restriction endonuclease